MSGAGRGIETLKKNLVIAFRPECSILALYPFPTALVCNKFVIDVYSTLTVTVSALRSTIGSQNLVKRSNAAYKKAWTYTSEIQVLKNIFTTSSKWSGKFCAIKCKFDELCAIFAFYCGYHRHILVFEKSSEKWTTVWFFHQENSGGEWGLFMLFLTLKQIYGYW